jgi:hypothetical protein
VQYPGRFPKKTWDDSERKQLRTLGKVELISLLKRDPNWQLVRTRGSDHVFYNAALTPPADYLHVHRHNEPFRNPSLLFWMLDHIGWTAEDLRRWKVLR